MGVSGVRPAETLPLLLPAAGGWLLGPARHDWRPPQPREEPQIWLMAVLSLGKV